MVQDIDDDAIKSPVYIGCWNFLWTVKEHIYLLCYLQQQVPEEKDYEVQQEQWTSLIRAILIWGGTETTYAQLTYPSISLLIDYPIQQEGPKLLQTLMPMSWMSIGVSG